MLLKFFTISKFHENTVPLKPDSPAMLLNLYFLVFDSVTSVDFSTLSRYCVNSQMNVT